MGTLSGKSIIVTGAGQGMGRRHVEVCVAEGAQVVASDIRADLVMPVAAALGPQAVAAPHDVTSESDWDRIVELALDEFGKIDGLINNAGYFAGPRSIIEEPFEEFFRTIQTNIVGAWWGIKKVSAPMSVAASGSIVNVSSTSGLRGYAGHTSYGTSKWALRGLTKTAAQDLGSFGIRVNSIHPGGIAGTGMYPVPRNEEERAARQANIPLARPGTVDEVAALATFLLSDSSSYTTGQEHVIDGGHSVG
jgi:3alpha(or 20beta)-hydroxysteroid dehydrogenase